MYNDVVLFVTYHLEGGQILLPPDVLLVFGTHCCYHIVEVHDYVNEGVEQSEECAVATC